jgi:hypothetical protein
MPTGSNSPMGENSPNLVTLATTEPTLLVVAVSLVCHFHHPVGVSYLHLNEMCQKTFFAQITGF